MKTYEQLSIENKTLKRQVRELKEQAEFKLTIMEHQLKCLESAIKTFITETKQHD